MEALLILTIIIALVFAILYFSARMNIDSAAREQYERWRASDLARIMEEQKAVAKREALADLDHWRSENEMSIRQDAIDRSRSVIIGKVTEHMTPWLPAFPYNPKDARFIGSPVDMIVFDGCDEDDLQRIVFLEIKTSGSGLSTRQRQIRDAIKSGRVEWRELRVKSNNGALSPASERPLLT